ncbi:MAG: hypothetical protein PVG33_09785, partial [Chloroflexota bacterium]
EESSYMRLADVTVADFSLFRVIDKGPVVEGRRSLNEIICFQNGLCAQAAAYDAGSGRLSVTWSVSRTLDLPDKPLISNPPPPNVYAGPRLLVFAQLLDEEGRFLTGDDGLWVDETTLWPGDTFRQTHYLPAAEAGSGYVVVFGLYDPMTGQRLATDDGRDHIAL